MMIHIVYEFIVWFISFVVLVWGMSVISAFLCNDYEDNDDNGYSASVNVNGQTASVNYNYGSGGSFNYGYNYNHVAEANGLPNCEELWAIFICLTILLLVMPSVHIYMWVVVDSCRKQFVAERLGMLMAMGGQPMMYPPPAGNQVAVITPQPMMMQPSVVTVS